MLFCVLVAVIWIIINFWEQYWQPEGHDVQFVKLSKETLGRWLTSSRLWRSILEWVRSLINQRCGRGCGFALLSGVIFKRVSEKKVPASSVHVKKPPTITIKVNVMDVSKLIIEVEETKTERYQSLSIFLCYCNWLTDRYVSQLKTRRQNLKF